MSDNKSIPIKDILGDPSHPAHAEIKALSEKLSSGEISLCACMGARYGEPYCSCEMQRRGLPPSPAHVAAMEEDDRKLKTLFESGALTGKA